MIWQAGRRRRPRHGYRCRFFPLWPLLLFTSHVCVEVFLSDSRLQSNNGAHVHGNTLTETRFCIHRLSFLIRFCCLSFARTHTHTHRRSLTFASVGAFARTRRRTYAEEDHRAHTRARPLPRRTRTNDAQTITKRPRRRRRRQEWHMYAAHRTVIFL